jgi:CRP-like cAMP-binding protein
MYNADISHNTVGDVIFAENDRVIGLYIIASGLVHVAGDTTRLSSANKGPLLLPGEYFGDYAVIMNEIQPYTVTAFSDVRTYKLSANACKSPAFEEVYTRLEAAFADASLAARKLDRKKSSRSGARRRRSHEVVLWHEGEAVPLGGEQLGEGEVRNAADIASIGVTVSTDEYDFTPRPPM